MKIDQVISNQSVDKKGGTITKEDINQKKNSQRGITLETEHLNIQR